MMLSLILAVQKYVSEIIHMPGLFEFPRQMIKLLGENGLQLLHVYPLLTWLSEDLPAVLVGEVFPKMSSVGHE